MKLKIERNQKKGMMGGVNFEISVSIVINETEKELVNVYEIGKLILLSRKRTSIFGQPSDDDITVTTNELLVGQLYKCKNLESVLSYEVDVKDAFLTFQTYMLAAAGFEGASEYVVREDEVVNILDLEEKN